MNQELLQLLPPSIFDRSADGDNDRFWRIFADQMDEVDEIFSDMRNVREIESQSGLILDLIGEMVWEKRDGKVDEQFRVYLIIAIQKMLCSCSIDSISAVFKALLGDNFIGVRDLFPGSPEAQGSDLYLDGSWFLDGFYYLCGSTRKPAFFDVAIYSSTSGELQTLSDKVMSALHGAGVSGKITVLEK